MLRSIKEMRGYNIVADDGEIGRVHEFLFDDRNWNIRYLVISTAKWLPGRKVLIPPSVLGRPDWAGRLFPIAMRKEQVKNSPPISSDEPVSRQHITDFNDYYLANWNPEWTLENSSDAEQPPAASVLPPSGSKPSNKENIEIRKGDPHLRSTHEVIGYRVQAVNDKVGHIDNFIVDDRSWVIHLAVIDTRTLLPSKKVQVSVNRIESILYGESNVFVDLKKDEINNLPEFDPTAPVNTRLEQVHYDYEGRRYC